MEVTIGSTAKEDTVPTLIVVTGSTDIAELGSNDVNTFYLTNTPTPNSAQSNTAFGTFDLRAHKTRSTRTCR
eukprot:14296357-Ditylum_brightwellii.AAC.1